MTQLAFYMLYANMRSSVVCTPENCIYFFDMIRCKILFFIENVIGFGFLMALRIFSNICPQYTRKSHKRYIPAACGVQSQERLIPTPSSFTSVWTLTVCKTHQPWFGCRYIDRLRKFFILCIWDMVWKIYTALRNSQESDAERNVN